MIIKNIEKKIRLAMLISVGSFVTCIIIAGMSMMFAYTKINEERNKIYVLDNGVPLLVNRTNQEVNRTVEYQGHVNLFHKLFFTLPPDNDFIEKNLQSSMYLIDDTGMTEYNNLKEKGYYNSILASSAVLSIIPDSIQVDMTTKQFKFYGTQRIDRETSVIKRSLVTTGYIKDVPRTINNPHGAIITNWKTIQNKDLSYDKKKVF